MQSWVFERFGEWDGERMCLSLLRNKFLIVGLLIYLMPGFAFWGYVLETMPQHDDDDSSGGIIDMWAILFILFFIGTSFAIPVILLIFQWWYMIPYFVISYGFLYLYWKKCKQKQNLRIIQTGSERMLEWAA
jgi:4-hydroxybenzoate polyprenyltransferase